MASLKLFVLLSIVVLVVFAMMSEEAAVKKNKMQRPLFRKALAQPKPAPKSAGKAKTLKRAPHKRPIARRAVKKAASKKRPIARPSAKKVKKAAKSC